MKSCARPNEALVRRLLTGTAVLTLALTPSAGDAAPLTRDLSVIAQAQPPAGESKSDADKDKTDKDKKRQRGPQGKPQGEPHGGQRGPATRPAPPQGQPPKPAAPPKVEAPKIEAPKPATPPAAHPPAAAPKPAAPAAPPKPAAPAPQQTAPKPAAPPPARPAAPATQPPKAEPPHAAPAPPALKETPKAETPKAVAPPPAAQPQQRSAPPAAGRLAPAQATPTQVAPPPPPPPTTTRNANEFLLKKGEKPAAPQINEVRKDRRETREGDRTVYRERDRTIVRDGGRTFIRHNESNRFAIDARDVRSQRRDGNTVTIVDRPNGVQIVTITDDDGDLIRRVRRENGREIVIIDNGERHRRRDYQVFIDLPPPVIRIPRDRYIVDARRAPRDVIYGAFLAPPVMALDRTYTLEQVRYSEPLRERMPRVDLDINFDTGSWQLAPDQIGELAVIAEGIKRAIARNPREVFMIEGYTDAVGSEIDNLSLSDRRAEAVAVALTDEFNVPPENLVTQGYGEQYLKVDTQGPERANRRVAVRRITPLIDQQAGR